MGRHDATRIPELLAPAGGPDALRAAVANGADAVYLGTRDLNARRGAENFDLASLADHTRYAHIRGARVYLTANVLVLEDEMSGALDLVGAAWQAGVDAVIVQDLGLMRLIRSELPDVRIHASTQFDAHNRDSVAALTDLGASRVTLARELSVTEIGALVADSPVELECFVHGSLCVCHSGQCLMSSLIGGRSANRGQCAQPCRLPYALVDAAGSEVAAPGRYLLSTADLAGVTLLPALVSAGVAALKIEGRMKSPEYVATVVRVYRDALDRAASDPDGFQVSVAEWDLLSEAFSRGFSEAYLADVRDGGMMSCARPNNRGLAVGRVTAVSGRSATVALERAVEADDTLEFWTGGGRHAQKAGEMTVSGRRAMAAPAGARAAIEATAAVRPGDRVFRVTNAALLAAARRTFASGAEARPVPARFSVRLRLGEPAHLTMSAWDLTAEATGAPVEPARTKPITASEVTEHVGRLGGTPYVTDGWRLEIEEGAGLAFSTLHALRREAIDKLEALRLEPWRRERPSISGQVAPPAPRRRREREVGARLVAAVSDPDVASRCLEAGADAAMVLVTPTTDVPPGAEPLLPRVAHDAETAALLARAEHRPATSGNLGLLAAIGRACRARDGGLGADWGLNVINPWSAEVLSSLGATLIWASPELSGRQLTELVRTSPGPVGAVVHGRLELMVTEHCVLQSAGPCARECAACRRRARRWSLRDRKGYVFPVRSDEAGRTHVYNSVPLDLSRVLGDIVAAGVAAVRLDLHTEGAEDAARLVKTYRSLLTDAVAGRPMPESPVVTPSTTGHYFRGLK